MTFPDLEQDEAGKTEEFLEKKIVELWASGKCSEINYEGKKQWPQVGIHVEPTACGVSLRGYSVVVQRIRAHI